MLINMYFIFFLSSSEKLGFSERRPKTLPDCSGAFRMCAVSYIKKQIASPKTHSPENTERLPQGGLFVLFHVEH